MIHSIEPVANYVEYERNLLPRNVYSSFRFVAYVDSTFGRTELDNDLQAYFEENTDGVQPTHPFEHPISRFLSKVPSPRILTILSSQDFPLPFTSTLNFEGTSNFPQVAAVAARIETLRGDDNMNAISLPSAVPLEQVQPSEADEPSVKRRRYESVLYNQLRRTELDKKLLQ